MEYFLSFGLVMGLASGLAPGPLLTLVIAESLQYGVKAGVKVAMAPVISDAPIIVVMLLVVDQLAEFNALLGVLSLLGACYVLYIAYDTVRHKSSAQQQVRGQSKSITKGILANVLNPHPYVFWLAVGAPTLIKAASVSALAPVVFMMGFYTPLVGSKVALAVLLGRHRNLLSGRGYNYVMYFLGLLLAIFAVLLFVEGINLIAG